MSFSTADAKKFMVAVVLVIVTLIFVARLLPYAWAYLQEGNATVNNQTYVLSDVPGGDLLTGLVIFLLVLVIGIALILRVFDVI